MTVVAASADQPKRRLTFSALLCNYNHAAFVETAIRSVVFQSRQPDEYLILDDGSTDESLAILERYAEKYSFIKLIRKERNRGLTAGMNELISLAQGDFIHFGSSDDFMQPGCIESLMAEAESHPEVGIVTGMMTIADEDGRQEQTLGIPGWKTGFYSPEHYLHEYLETSDPTCVLSASTILRRAAVVECGGWRQDLGIWHVSFAIQAAALKYGICYVDKPCYTWVYRRNGLTHRTNVNVAQSLTAYENYLNLITSEPYRHYFSPTFARRWFEANVVQVARSYAVDHAESVISRLPEATAVSRPKAA